MLFKLYFISVSRSYLVFNNKAHDPGKKKINKMIMLDSLSNGIN